MPEHDESARSTGTRSPINQPTESDFEEKIRTLFDRSASNVQAYSSKIKHDYFNPAYDYARTFSQVYPVLSVFVGINAVLGFLPVVFFLSASLFILSASVAAALTLAIAFAVSVISFFGLLLLFALFWISVVSIAATVLVLSAYQVVQLIANVRGQPTLSAGIKKWAFDLHGSALARLPTQSSTERPSIAEPPRGSRHEEMFVKVEGTEAAPF